MTAVVVHASDGSGDDLRARDHAAALAAAGGARLVTVHIDADGDDVADAVIEALGDLQPDLVVTGTHGRHGLAAVLHGSVAEAIARNARVPTLVVPNEGRGFVDAATGAISLAKVLLPVDGRDDARGEEAARRLLALAGAPGAAIVTFHADGGDVPAAIVARAAAVDACAIVMVTHGHDGVGDALRGSRTDRVIRDAACPVLAVPA